MNSIAVGEELVGKWKDVRITFELKDSKNNYRLLSYMLRML